MSERSVLHAYLSGQLAEIHAEILAMHTAHQLCDQGVLDPADYDDQVYRLVGMLPDDMRPAGVPATPFRNKPKKKSAEDLL